MLASLRESRVIDVLFIVIAVGAVIAAILRLTGLGASRWPLASFTAFALYAVPLVLLIAVIALVLGQRIPAAVLAASAIAVGITIASRATAEPQPAATGQQVRIMSANLLHGGADTRALAALVHERQPDVLAMQEYMGRKTEARLRAAGVLDELPYLVARPADGRWKDTAIASRWPLELVELPGVPTVYLVARATIPATADQAATTLPLVSAHPTPPMRPANQRRWEDWLAALPAPQGPLAGGLVAGDFNATLDHIQFRDVLDRGWRDVADELGEGLKPTWKGGAKITPTRALRLTIDHILLPPGAAARDYVIDPLPGSDHRAVTATIVLPAAPAPPQ